MRAPGEVRTVLLGALREQGPLPLRDLAHMCQIGYDAARYTLQNATRAGVVEIVGNEKRPHSKKWVALYGLAPDPAESQTPTHDSPFMVLGDVLNRWR